MQNQLKYNEGAWIWTHKAFEIKLQKGIQIIQTFLKIDSPQKLGLPLQLLEISKLLKKYSWIIKNALKSNACGWIWVHTNFEIETQ